MSFVAAAEENYDCFAVASEVDPIPGSEVYAPFGYTFANMSDIAEISVRHAFECDSDASGGAVVETPEPTSKRASSAFVVVFT